MPAGSASAPISGKAARISAALVSQIDWLSSMARDDGVRALTRTAADVERLWDVCQVPDYRKIAPANHAELVVTLYGYLQRDGRIETEFAPCVLQPR